MPSRINNAVWYLIFTVLVLVLFLSNLWYGSIVIPWDEVWKSLIGSSEEVTSRVIVMEYRLPQAITAMITGMALGIAGLLLQTIFRNPLAGPSVLGISSGASFGVAVVILAGWSPWNGGIGIFWSLQRSRCCYSCFDWGDNSIVCNPLCI